MNSLARLSSPFFFALLVPLSSQAQDIKLSGQGLGDLLAQAFKQQHDNPSVGEKLPSRSSPKSVPVRFTGKSTGDTTVQMSNDSAVAMLKASHAQIFFLDNARSSKSKVVKLVGSSINGIEVAYGDAMVSQYGDEAKNGVVTILTNAQVAKEKADQSKQGDGRTMQVQIGGGAP